MRKKPLPQFGLPLPVATLSLATLLLAAAAASLIANNAWSEDSKGSLTLAVENDLFGAGTDKHYTHGTEITYVSDTYQPSWLLTAASWMPFFESNVETRFVTSLGQQIYTPADTQTESLVADDRPYAGWLYGSVGLLNDYRASARYVDKLELVVGLVGPQSGAQSVQRTVHKWIGSDISQGWDNQLHNETTVDLQYQRTWMLPLVDNNIDVVPDIGFTLGTSQRYVQTGATLRIGSGLGADFGPPLIRPGAAGGQYFKPVQNFYWYLFGGAHGRYVEHNIFLDGNTDHDSHSVRKNSWVGDLQAGLVMGIGNWRLTLTEILRSKEFEGQDDPDEFGAIAVTYRL
ncbi:MAG TPA: lipid A deacylase LpxR family protein [Spongiibacteraceae bacterium]|nr:lipid A deacylase LpxR family protein [Spongiibacteraceae bacterium]